MYLLIKLERFEFPRCWLEQCYTRAHWHAKRSEKKSPGLSVTDISVNYIHGETLMVWYIGREQCPKMCASVPVELEM